jgi:exosortase
MSASAQPSSIGAMAAAATKPAKAKAKSQYAPAPTGPVTYLLSRQGALITGVIAILFVWAFHWFFLQQHRFSWASADWQHAYFVPIISIYLLWQVRHQFVGLKPEIFWPGLIPLIMSIPCYMLFQLGSLSTHMGQGWSMLLALFGVLLLLLGPKMIRPILLPLAFLLFGITVAERVMIGVTFQLQGIAAYGGWALLNLIGIDTEMSGNTLTVFHDGKKFPLNIAEACSGMRMVIAFAALGVAVALAGLRHWWQRIALIALSIPVAVGMNVVRVAVLGVVTLYDEELARGESHIFIGLIMMVIAFFIFMGAAWALGRIIKDDPAGPKPIVKWIDRGPISAAGFFNKGTIVAAGVLLLSAASMQAAIAGLGIHLKKLPIQAAEGRQVSAIPKETDSWIQVGTDEVMSAEMLEELGTKNYLNRVYRQKQVAAGKTPRHVTLHLAYYTGMIDTVPHVPERCMTGAGFQMVADSKDLPLKFDAKPWRPDEAASQVLGAPVLTGTTGLYSDRGPNRRVRLPVGIENAEMRFSAFSVGTGNMKATSHAGYFFIANGGLSASAEGVRALAFKLDDDYAYYLKVQVQTTDVESAEELRDLASNLIGELLPEIMRCVPDWTNVVKGDFPADNPRRRQAETSSGK